MAQATSPRAFQCRVRFIDTQDGHVKHDFTLRSAEEEPRPRIRFSPSGKLLAVTPDFSSLRVIDVSTGRIAWQQDELPFIHALAFSPDGTKIAIAHHADEEHIIAIWDAESGQKTRSLSLPSNQPPHALAFGPDGQKIAVGGKGQVLIAPVNDARDIRLVEMPIEAVVFVAFIANGKKLVAGGVDGKVRVWDLHVSKTCLDWEASGSCFAVSPDGETLAAASFMSSNVRLWNLTTGRELFQQFQRGHRSPVLAIAFAPDGRTLVSSGLKDATLFWDVNDARVVREVQATARQVVFLPDRQRLATLAWDNRESIHIWSAAPDQAKLHWTIDDPDNDSSGFWLMAATEHRIVTSAQRILKDIDDVPCARLCTWDPLTGKCLTAIGRETLDARSLSVTPDGRVAAIGGFRGQIAFVDLHRGRDISMWDAHEGEVAVAVSPDGRMLGSAGIDGRVRIWEVITGKEIYRFKCRKGLDLPSLVFSHDSQWLAVGQESEISVWEMTRGKEVRRLDSDELSVCCLAASPDGKVLAAGMRDSTVLLWHATSFGEQPKEDGTITDYEFNRLWDDLASLDANRAYRARSKLLSVSDRTVFAAKQSLSPASKVSLRHLQQLLSDLDHSNFAIRERAQKELGRLEEQAESFLEKALDRARTAEGRRRIEKLLAPPRLVREPERMRAIRAVHILEQIGTAEAKSVLRILAKGDPEAHLTQASVSSLRRLEIQKD